MAPAGTEEGELAATPEEIEGVAVGAPEGGAAEPVTASPEATGGKAGVAAGIDDSEGGAAGGPGESTAVAVAPEGDAGVVTTGADDGGAATAAGVDEGEMVVTTAGGDVITDAAPVLAVEVLASLSP